MSDKNSDDDILELPDDLELDTNIGKAIVGEDISHELGDEPAKANEAKLPTGEMDIETGDTASIELELGAPITDEPSISTMPPMPDSSPTQDNKSQDSVATGPSLEAKGLGTSENIIEGQGARDK